MGLEAASGKWTDWGTTDDWKGKKIRPWPGVYQVRSVAADGAPVQLDLCGAFVKGTGKCRARKHMSGLGIEGVVYIGMTVNLYHRFGLLLRSWAANHPKKPHGARSNWNQSPWLQKTYPLESMEFRCKAIGTRDRNEWNAAVSTRGPSGKRNLALLTLLADGGLRLGEALALTTKDLVREDGGSVVTHVRLMGKGSKPALMPITTRTAARLDAWLHERAALGLGNGPVFCTVSRGHREAGFATDGTLTPGTPLNPRYVLALVARVAQKAGIERRITPHTLRHTFATHLLRRTGNLELTRKALRHSRITTTATVYSHLLDRDVEEAVRDLREEATPVDPQVQALAEALGRLTPEQRKALAEALGKGG